MTGSKVKLSKSSISSLEKEAVLKVLDKNFLGMGDEVQVFEKKIKAYLKTQKEVVCVNTGTSALHLSLEALNLGEGDEVLVPSLTYVATFQAISATGATPIPCEVNPATLFMDAHDAKKRITKNTKVILPVHYASNSEGIDEIYALAKSFNLRVIEDAAQSFGSIRKGNKIGYEGDIICFSFDGIKNITSGEGGAILSSDKEFIHKVKDTRLLGIEKDTEQRFMEKRSWDFDVKEQGYRYHMSNIMAAIGIVQLERIEEFKVKRQAIAHRYINLLKEIKGISFLSFNFKEILPHIFVIKAERRDILREFLMKNGIESGIHYKPNHLLTKYSSEYTLQMTEKIYDEILTLPCHYDLTINEQNLVIDSIRKFYGQ